MLGIGDVAAAGKLIALLSLLARALAVSLAGDHGIAAAFAADAPAGHDQVDRGDAVIHALGVVLDAAGMQQETGWRRAPHLGGADDHLRRHAGNPGGILRRVLLHRLGKRLEAGGVLRDEVAVDPAALDHDVQHAVEDADVAAGAHRNEQVGIASDRRHARIEDDQLAAVLARLPQVVGGDGSALGDVRARGQDDLRFGDVGPGIGAAVDAENLLRRGPGGHHAEASVVINVGGPQSNARELAHQVGFLVGKRGAGQHGERIVAVRLLNALDLADDAAKRRVPGDRLEAFARDALQRILEPVRVLVLHVALYALGAELAAIEGKVLPRLKADDLVVAHSQLDAALLPTEAAMGLHHSIFFFRAEPIRLRGRG